MTLIRDINNILEYGHKTTSYKYATLLAIFDYITEHPSEQAVNNLYFIPIVYLSRQFISYYYKSQGKYPTLLIVISEKYILYYDKDLSLRKEREIDQISIISLIECLFEPKSVNSDQFAVLFGVNSPLYILAYSRLEKHFDEHHGEKTVCFDQWKRHFSLAYHDDKVGTEV